MASKFLPLYLTIAFSLFFTSSSVPSKSVENAADALMNSGFVSMSLTLQFGSQSLLPQTPSLTIFSPPDTVFEESGQPSLPVLLYHFSPNSFSFNSLKSFSIGKKIPTLFANHSLIISSSDSDNDSAVFLNGVQVDGPAMYDDGSLVVFGVERFFDPEFEISGGFSGLPGSNIDCPVVNGIGDYEEANGVLRLRGYTIMASFLDLQLKVENSQNRITVLAPTDELLKGLVQNLSAYKSIFLRHVIPCKILSKGLSNLNDGTTLPTYFEGFNIVKNGSGGVLLLNGVQVLDPDMYISERLVIHGIRGNFMVKETFNEAAKPPSGGKKSFGMKVRVNFTVMVLLLTIKDFLLFSSAI